MDINQILNQLDSLFQNKKINEVESFLNEKIALAQSLGEYHVKITLLNEMIGFCRDTSQFDKSIQYSEQVLDLMKKSGLEGTIPYGTTLLNVANAYRAAGLLTDSLDYYQEVFRLYQGNLNPEDFRYASLNNNLSLLYQEMNQFDKAVEALENALHIVLLYENARIELATTYTNLAMSLLKLKRYEEAIAYLEIAFPIFEQDINKDYHYSGALSAMGEAQYLAGNLVEAANYYEKALYEIESNVGRTKAYEITKENLIQIQKQIGKTETIAQKKIEIDPETVTDSNLEKQETSQKADTQVDSGLEICRKFYETYGAPMIQEKFPEYANKIAVGLVGEGSDCFGFDDEISRDHDFGPGFCMWLTEDVFSEIGEKLSEEYNKLPNCYMGIKRTSTKHGEGRVGVWKISDFYKKIVGYEQIPETEIQWLSIEEEQLAAIVNGQVFRDDMGVFTTIRNQFKAYYPDGVWRKKLAQELTLMSQLGQYNYERMLKRNELVTAQIILHEYMIHTLKTVYLLNRQYAPYYKWLHRGCKNLPILPEIPYILNAIVDMPQRDERIGMTIEIIATLIVNELNNQKLSRLEDNYLESHGETILAGAKNSVEELIALEWDAFDQVKNEGGRADCQDDWNTFSIMRRSQYITWNEELLQSYIQDFKNANNKGWNLITEKYGRMMESTAPLKFQEIKQELPLISEEKAAIIQQIVEIQVRWMELFSAEYPYAAGNARSIRSSEDTSTNTSYETYLKGEISTYSSKTLELYGRFIVDLLKSGQNLAQITMENTARLYGYQSLTDLEEKLKKYAE